MPLIDDDRLSDISSLRVAGSLTRLTSSFSEDRDLPGPPQDELDTDNDRSSGVDPSSEDSMSAAVPGFFPKTGRPSSTPPEILRVNPPPDSILHQLREQDHLHSATSSSSSASSSHSYSRFFHRSRTPKRTLSIRSLGPGGIHSGLGALTPIYEPSNPDLKDLAATQKEGEAGPSSAAKNMNAPSIHSTTSTIQEKIMNLQGKQMKDQISSNSDRGLSFRVPLCNIYPLRNLCHWSYTRMRFTLTQISNSPGVPQPITETITQPNLLQLASFRSRWRTSTTTSPFPTRIHQYFCDSHHFPDNPPTRATEWMQNLSTTVGGCPNETFAFHHIATAFPTVPLPTKHTPIPCNAPQSPVWVHRSSPEVFGHLRGFRI